MDLARVLERWHVPAHNGNTKDAAPYRVRLAPLSRGAYLALVAAVEGLRASSDDAAVMDAVRVWGNASASALDSVIAVEGLTDADEPVPVERFRSIAASVPELRAEIVQVLMASAALGGDEGKV